DLPECAALVADFHKAAGEAGAELMKAKARDKKRYSRLWAAGPNGTYLPNLTKAYAKHGFRAAFYPAAGENWGRVLDAARAGQPVQVGLDINGWRCYSGTGPMPHAVVVEGEWTDDSGVDRMLIVDPNAPSLVKS